MTFIIYDFSNWNGAHWFYTQYTFSAFGVKFETKYSYALRTVAFDGVAQPTPADNSQVPEETDDMPPSQAPLLDRALSQLHKQETILLLINCKVHPPMLRRFCGIRVRLTCSPHNVSLVQNGRQAVQAPARQNGLRASRRKCAGSARKTVVACRMTRQQAAEHSAGANRSYECVYFSTENSHYTTEQGITMKF